MISSFIFEGAALAQANTSGQTPAVAAVTTMPVAATAGAPTNDKDKKDVESDNKDFTAAIIGLVGTIIGAGIAGLFGYLFLMHQLKANAQLGFMQLLLANKTDKDKIDGFINTLNKARNASNKAAFNKELSEKLHEPIFFYLFLLKNDQQLDKQLCEAIFHKDDETKVARIEPILKKLLSVT